MPGREPDPILRHSTFEKRLTASRQAVMAGDYARALQLCEAALELRPQYPFDQKAHSVCAVSACRLKELRTARRHIAAIWNAKIQEQHRMLCRMNGVDL